MFFLRKFLLFLAFFSQSACFANYYSPITGDLPNETLIGEWKPTVVSVNFLKSENLYFPEKEIRLDFTADNKFKLSNMPDCWINDFGEFKGNTFSYQGTWELYSENKNGYWLFLTEKNGNRLITHSIPIVLKQNKIQILFVFGDQDRGREIFLEKTNS